MAEALLNGEIDITLVDSDINVIERINEHLDVLTVQANGLELKMLKELKIETYDLLVASTSSDESNTIICSLAKKLGCSQTIARIRNPEYTEQLDFMKKEMGIDHVVNPDLALSNEIARYLSKDYHFFSGDYARGKVQMIDIGVNSIKEWIGKKIMDFDDLDSLLITAILRNGDTIIPNGNTKLLANDVIYIIGKTEMVNKLAEKYKSYSKTKKKDIEKIMILGGGNVGYYLAKHLTNANISVRIIEQDKERCKYLIEKLKNTLIIHGDGTDINLLEEEELIDMDAFIGATGYDEQNLLMALMAKQEGVNKSIAKISKPSYEHLIEKLGIDVAFNPVNITASDILKFIRGGKVVSVSLLLTGQAEVTEVIVGKKIFVVGKKIEELKLPKGIIIGSIVREELVIIPNGGTYIYEGDRLIIFCLLEHVPLLDIFIKPIKRGKLSELWNRNQGIRKLINP
ncbi:MAG: Trk system potassium transporter TrkA [Bacteroidales bacterium]|nr:Trk system potassium transporter TrkA [Bacteroidales bacterium]